MADILADGERVGICLAEHDRWRAYLYVKRGAARVRAGKCEEVTGRRLRDVRRELRERVELKGVWWA
jgi:hypothetical protein